MEIIDELEKEKRGPYAGCIGYFGANGEMDTCIVLRTAIVKDGRMSVQAGAGIVYDSDPAVRAAGVHQQGKGAVPRGGGRGEVREPGEKGAVAPPCTPAVSRCSSSPAKRGRGTAEGGGGGKAWARCRRLPGRGWSRRAEHQPSRAWRPLHHASHGPPPPLRGRG